MKGGEGNAFAKKFQLLSFEIIALLSLLLLDPLSTYRRLTIRAALRVVVLTKGVLFSGQFSSHSEFQISSDDLSRDRVSHKHAVIR